MFSPFCHFATYAHTVCAAGVFCHAALCCIALHGAALYCIALRSAVSCCIALYGATLYCIALRNTSLCDMFMHDMSFLDISCVTIKYHLEMMLSRQSLTFGAFGAYEISDSFQAWGKYFFNPVCVIRSTK